MIRDIKEFERLGGDEYVVGMFYHVYDEFDDLHRQMKPPDDYVDMFRDEKFAKKFDRKNGMEFAKALWTAWPFVANETFEIWSWADDYMESNPEDFVIYVMELMDM